MADYKWTALEQDLFDAINEEANEDALLPEEDRSGMSREEYLVYRLESEADRSSYGTSEARATAKRMLKKLGQ